ncbi:MAG: bifunctional diguanylate cyclase/phosphodiesterase [Leptolyngbyaceae cyanobacterium SM1_4_3]|nr:bifunctional diguanylate cyclase/phosphodiesterase [Leptolyngbyaceae cyanobacterium SM1_4_3]NJN89578.1 bifunctional diguanylate cyclase/phosphodiesterase [Leptolyngbyaceae cyanobacterium SL_5_14]
MVPNLAKFSNLIRSKLSDLSDLATFPPQFILLSSSVGVGLGLLLLGSTSPMQAVGGLLSCLGILLIWRSHSSAFRDRLTGLPNRTLFMRRLERSVRQTNQRKQNGFAVLFLDLDRFKSMNKKFGSKRGDRLLVKIASRLKTSIGSHDFLARVGGNEFAILLSEVQSEEQASWDAHHLQVQLNLPFEIDTQEICLTTSIGIALSSAGYVWSDDLLRDAQTAMYHAKSLGRARYALFQPSMRVQAVTLLQIETDLRRAVERQELRLHYQPLVSLQTGKIVGFEALARWQHPKHGLIAPAEFIPIAEDSGLITSVGYWAMLQACYQLRIWQQRFLTDPPLMVSVNLSSRQFAQPNLINQVECVLAETGLDAQSLKLEITESMVMEDIEAAIATLEQIKALNVRLGIDDFGTGYSSLSHLYRFPADTLKVDQSFISRIGLDEENNEIVRAIVTLAHNLGMTVIAEGIETQEQLAMLRSLNCEYGQGYFFSEPLNHEAAATLFAAAPRW